MIYTNKYRENKFLFEADKSNIKKEKEKKF